MFYIRALLRFIALQRQSPAERFAPPQPPQSEPRPKQQRKKFKFTRRLGWATAATLVVGWQAWSFLKVSMRPDYVQSMTHQGYRVTAEKMRLVSPDDGPDEFYQLASTDSLQGAVAKLDKAMKQEFWEPDAHQPSIIAFTPRSKGDVGYRTDFLNTVGLSLPLPATSSFVRTYQIDYGSGYINAEFFQVNGETIIEIGDVNRRFS